MSDAPEQFYLVYKRGRGFYKPNSQGYTSQPFLAGRFKLEEARQITHPNGLNGPRDGMRFFPEARYKNDEIVATVHAQIAQARREGREAGLREAVSALQSRLNDREFCDTGADELYSIGALIFALIDKEPR
jgi:hypothetical protein